MYVLVGKVELTPSQPRQVRTLAAKIQTMGGGQAAERRKLHHSIYFPIFDSVM